MSLNDWRAVNLLSEVAVRDRDRGITSERQRTRMLFEQLAALTLFQSTTTLWRGQARADHPMQPSMARDGRITKRAIDDLLEQTKRATLYSKQGIQVRGSTELETLALLQHTGTHTPLLDLTADPLVALYFAVSKHDDLDGILIGFSARRHWVEVTHHQAQFWNLTKTLRSNGQVGWLIPPVVSDRVVVQRSRLVVASPITTDHWAKDIGTIALPALPRDWTESSLHNLFDFSRRGQPSTPPVVGFRIPRDLKPWMRAILSNNYGISHESLFPEPEGFSERP